VQQFEASRVQCSEVTRAQSRTYLCAVAASTTTRPTRSREEKRTQVPGSSQVDVGCFGEAMQAGQLADDRFQYQRTEKRKLTYRTRAHMRAHGISIGDVDDNITVGLQLQADTAYFNVSP